MSRVFTREEFYELVWSKPMTHLATEFALSDVALHKICKKHDIPKPPVGWWAKKAAGKFVKQTPLPPARAGTSERITIAAGELRDEPELIAAARENARVLASSINADIEPPSHPIVERTSTRLRKTKPDAITGLVALDGAGLIKAQVAPASIDRLERALNRIIAAAEALGIKLTKNDKAAAFVCEGETIGFSVSESTRREKHVLTEKEQAQEEAKRRKREQRWSRNGNRNEWDDLDFDFSRPRFPEWDYHPTGLLSFELEQFYLLSGSPRRSFRDAKVQRIETMATDIAVGVAVLAAAKKDDRLRREEEARKREEARRRHELAQRAQYVEERRGDALNKILEDIAALDRLRRLVAGLRAEHGGAAASGRLQAFMAFAEGRLANREAALSAEGLGSHFEEQRLFGDDDDHDFHPRRYY